MKASTARKLVGITHSDYYLYKRLMKAIRANALLHNRSEMLIDKDILTQYVKTRLFNDGYGMQFTKSKRYPLKISW